MNLYCRKDGRWEGLIPRGKKKNGKRKFQYIISRNKEDVISRINMIRQSEQNYQSCYKTLDAIFYEWFNTVKYHIKESTASNYRMKAEKHILPSFGEKLIDSITQKDIYNFIDQKRKDRLSDRYIADIIILIKGIFKYSVKTYHIFNPMEGLVLPKRKNTEIQLLDSSEQSKLQEYISKNQNLGTLGTALSYSTGIRIGELCALQWKDIDFEKRILTVRKTMQRIQCPTEISKTKLIITDPKSESSRRRIPIPDCMVGFLHKFKEESGNYVLTGSKKPVEPRTIQYRFASILKNAKLPSVHFHALRHIFASSCIRLGFDVKALSELLGHSSVEITLNRYVHGEYYLAFKGTSDNSHPMVKSIKFMKE